MYLWEMMENIFLSLNRLISLLSELGVGKINYNSTTSNYRQEHYVEAV